MESTKYNGKYKVQCEVQSTMRSTKYNAKYKAQFKRYSYALSTYLLCSLYFVLCTLFFVLCSLYLSTLFFVLLNPSNP